ncbi:olfactory receptor 5V1-like [Pelobates fuscus]|uniref:olfactory receptor 5V1-like n=1 Tax=Pelobates fuscus TaxID=191477 RepID=UPI002FE4C1F7
MTEENVTSSWNGFIFVGFPNILGSQSGLFVIFLSIYIMTLFGNLTIIFMTTFEFQLQTPMYFLLGQLSLLDLCYITVTVPKMLSNFLNVKKTISLGGCITQLLFFISMEGTEAFLLTAMAYDRYVAICFPLRYTSIMNRCWLLVAVAWVIGFCNSLVHTTLTFSLPFCGSHKLNHYFCDIPPLLQISCKETQLNELVLVIVGGICIGFSSFICILVSYTLIIFTILRITSANGKLKVFSTCGPHLIVVALFYGTAIFTYIRPSSAYSLQRDSFVSVMYSVVPPMLNPIVYSLRNKEIKRIVGKRLCGREEIL